MTRAEADRIEHVKDCDCKNAMASVGWPRQQTIFNEATQHYTVQVTLHPGPVCNACDKPWKRVK